MAPIFDVPVLLNSSLHIITPRAASLLNVTSPSLPSPTISSTTTAFNPAGNGESSYVETLAFSLLGLFLAFLGVVLAYLQLRKMNIIEVSRANTDITELGQTITSLLFINV